MPHSVFAIYFAYARTYVTTPMNAYASYDFHGCLFFKLRNNKQGKKDMFKLTSSVLNYSYHFIKFNRLYVLCLELIEFVFVSNYH